MRTYTKIEQDIAKILNNRVYGGKGKFIKLLKELKDTYGIELSYRRLKELMKKKDENKLKKLTMGLSKDLKIVVYRNPFGYISYNTLLKDYYINKWGELRVRLIPQSVGKEFAKKDMFSHLVISV